jgi:DNA-binding MarR family transcriptional regulator
MAKKTKKKEVKTFTPAKRAKMASMLKDGTSVYAIAKELNLTPSVARYHAKRMIRPKKLVNNLKGEEVAGDPKTLPARAHILIKLTAKAEALQAELNNINAAMKAIEAIEV